MPFQFQISAKWLGNERMIDQTEVARGIKFKSAITVLHLFIIN